MRIVVAPDSFKGSLSAVAVAENMEKGILSVFPNATITKVPVADSGEGTVEALVAATGGKIIREKVMGPLGDYVAAYWGILGDGETAVIEMASASGLPLVPKGQCNPLIATTYGTGELIKAALDYDGISKIIIGLGGSATNDGGAGMAQALGVRFLNDDNNELPLGGSALNDLARIDLSKIDPRLKKIKILAACDVDNPLFGPLGASTVFGPQKGATPENVIQLDHGLKKFAQISKQVTGKDVAHYPGAGAAGGLGAGLLLFTNAQLRPGVQIVLESIGFEETIKQADLVITGEGSTDYQTAYGKTPVGVAGMARQHGIPTVCLSGGLGKGHEKVMQFGINGIMSIVPRPMLLEECIENAEELVQSAAARTCLLIKIGMGM